MNPQTDILTAASKVHEAGAPMSYCAGFVFRKNASVQENQVALIRKLNPPWQRGLLNGIGGKVEIGETPLQAQVREFAEEAGEHIPADQWNPFCYLQNPHANWGVVIFSAFVEFKFTLQIRSVTKEEVSWNDIASISNSAEVIHQLRWLIPLALSRGVMANVFDPSK